jgi:hypothetical protein
MNQRCFAVLLLLVISSQSLANVIVSENFDSYNSTADMQVNWGNTGLGTLVGGGNGGNAASHPGGAVNSWIGSTFSLTPTDARPVILTADIFDDGTSANERMTVGLRNGADPLFEMGFYNQPGATFYAVRVLNMYNNENWTALPLDPNSPVAGWHRFRAVFTGSSLTVTLDLNSNGIIDSTFVSNGSPSANPFVDLRFGGPSNSTSAGGGALFDNITLQQVPEPSSMALCGVCLAGLAGYRRRRS